MSPFKMSLFSHLMGRNGKYLIEWQPTSIARGLSPVCTAAPPALELSEIVEVSASAAAARAELCSVSDQHFLLTPHNYIIIFNE